MLSESSWMVTGRDKDEFTVSFFFGIFAALVLSAIVFFYVLHRRKPEDVRRLEIVQLEYEAHRLVHNFHLQLSVLCSLPKFWRKPYSFHPHVIGNAMSWASVFLFIASVLIIIQNLVRESSAAFRIWWYQPNELLVIAILLFTLSSNCYMNCRQYIYHIEKQQERLLIRSMRHTTMSSRPNVVPCPNGSNPPNNDTVQSNLNNSSIVNNNSNVNNISNNPSHTSHYDEDANLNFYSFRWSFRNILQLLTLPVELVQIISLPLRDLLNNPVIKDRSTVQGFDSIMSFATLIPDRISTTVLYQMQFWTFFGVTMACILLAALLRVLQVRWDRKVPLFWVFNLVPIACIVFLPVLVAFVSSAACLSESSILSQALRCPGLTVSRPLYISCSLIGFLASYILFTLFLVSDERKPRKGDVAFRPASVAFIKNMAFLLVIIFLLVPVKRAVVRGLASIFIVTTMLAYNVRLRSCVVYQINLLRSLGLAWILWTTVVVTIVNDEQILQSLDFNVVIGAFVVGYLITLIVFILVYRRQIARKAHTSNISTTPSSSLPPSVYDSAVGPVTTINTNDNTISSLDILSTSMGRETSSTATLTSKVDYYRSIARPARHSSSNPLNRLSVLSATSRRSLPPTPSFSFSSKTTCDVVVDSNSKDCSITTTVRSPVSPACGETRHRTKRFGGSEQTQSHDNDDCDVDSSVRSLPPSSPHLMPSSVESPYSC